MIEEKLRLFSEQKELNALAVSREQVAEMEMRYTRSLDETYFEIGASFHSATFHSGFRVFLGAYSYMNDLGYIRPNTFIGRYCSIGRRVTISAGMHPMHGVSTHPALRKQSDYSSSELDLLEISEVHHAAPQTTIHNDVWIGDGAVIMPGVEIGNSAIIGANAVVTRDVPPYAIVGGTPARVIKYRFPEDVIQRLLNSQWWNLPHKALTQLPTGNVYSFLESLKAQTLAPVSLATLCMAKEEEEEA